MVDHELSVENLNAQLAEPGLSSLIRNENGQDYLYQGLGDAFVRTLADAQEASEDLTVPVMTGTTKPVNPGDTVEHLYEDAPVKTQVFFEGKLMGGITKDGKIILRGFDDTEGVLLRDFTDKISISETLQRESGLRPIFSPEQPDFNPDRPGEHKEQDARETRILEKFRAFKGKFADKDDGYLRAEARIAATLMEPAFSIDVGGRTFYVSSVFRAGHPFAAVYSDLEADPVLFYQSKSHSTWRALLMSDITEKEWFGKGFMGYENSTDAPIELQIALDQNLQLQPLTEALDYSAVYALTQPEPPGAKETTRLSALAQGAELMESHGVEQPDWDERTFDYSDFNSSRKLFLPRFVPDLTKPLRTWKIINSQYGEVTATVYPSKNGEIRYVICQTEVDGKEQHWISTAEYVDSVVTDLGLRSKFPQLSLDVTEPPIDHTYGEEKSGYERRSEQSEFESFIVRALSRQKRPRKKSS